MSLSHQIAESYIRLCDEGHDSKLVADSVVSFLKENKLESLRNKVLEHVEAVEVEKADYLRLNIRTAKKLDSSTTKTIANKVCDGDDCEITQVEDEELIGGFVARHKGREWDASVSGILQRLKSNLKQK